MPSTPTATDEKLEGRIDGLTATLADFRLETEKRFGSVETTLGDIRSDLKWIKVIGGFIIALLIASGSGAARIIWDAATIASDMRQQGGLRVALDQKTGIGMKSPGKLAVLDALHC